MWCARSRRRTCRGPTTASPIRAIPKPCCSAGSIASTASASSAAPARPTATTANTDSSSLDPAQETTLQTVRTMIAGRRAVAGIVVRAAAAAGCALFVGGCNTDQVATSPDVPTDYRLRHPITLQESNHTVELFIGSNRGELTPTQRAQVLSFGLGWKHEATGGIVVERPVGSR